MSTSHDPAKLARRLDTFLSRGRRSALPTAAPGVSYARPLESYRDDPVGFCTDVLGVTLTLDQEAIVRQLPGRAKVNSGHSLGKTMLAACASLWWFYTRPKSVVITTAPTEKDVIDLLWMEIRILHGKAKRPLPDFFAGPKSAEMFENEEHWAKGYTARDAVSFQGRHRASMLFIFDEAEGVAAHFWEVTNTSYKDGYDHGWLAIGNPVTTGSQSYVEDRAKNLDGTPKWKLFSLSALNHPNVVAELAGKPAPIPNAVSVNQIDGYVADWCDRIDPSEKRENDFEWRPGSGNWYRPGPQMLARAMGIRPEGGIDTVWGMAVWRSACTPKYTPEFCWTHRHGLTVGVDCASYGDDYTCIHVRSGPLSLHHESRNGWPPRRIADRIKELCVEWAAWYNAQGDPRIGRPPLQPADVRVAVELDAIGADVLDHCTTPNGGQFGAWGGLKVAEASDDLDQLGTPKYANKRSEIWFTGAHLAATGGMDLSRLPQDVLRRLEDQFLTPSYKTLPAGTRQVEAKADIKKRLKRSPDDADSLLVCYSETSLWAPSLIWKAGA